MASLNTPASGHGNQTEHYASGLIIDFNVFLSGNATEVTRLSKIKQAVQIIDRLNNKIDLYGPCTTYFKSLPKGKSFSELWNDALIFVNYSPAATKGFYGATHSNDKDICISAWCLDTHNKWVIAATIVHELAHVAGAPGGVLTLLKRQ